MNRRTVSPVRAAQRARAPFASFSGSQRSAFGRNHRAHARSCARTAIEICPGFGLLSPHQTDPPRGSGRRVGLAISRQQVSRAHIRVRAISLTQPCSHTSLPARGSLGSCSGAISLPGHARVCRNGFDVIRSQPLHSHFKFIISCTYSSLMLKSEQLNKFSVFIS